MRHRVLLGLPLVLVTLLGALLVAAPLFMAVPARAHHTFSVEYDASKCSDMTGTLTKVDWQNPHVYFYVDLKEADNQVSFLELRGGLGGLSEEERDPAAGFRKQLR